MMLVAVIAFAAVASAAPPASNPGGALAASDPIARLDALYRRRSEVAALREAQQVADAALRAAPGDYGILWRAARVYFVLSDDPGRSDDERARSGAIAWDLGQRAVAANPNDVAGHYWSALGIGNSALGMGVLRALAKGIEGKFTGELERATALDSRYDSGNVYVAWAAYHMELPWPKRDRAKAERELQQALSVNPASLNARLYLARLLVSEGRAPEARARLAEIAAAPAGRYDLAEELHAKADAAKLAMSLSP